MKVQNITDIEGFLKQLTVVKEKLSLLPGEGDRL
mgnify:CR=1 FL=1